MLPCDYLNFLALIAWSFMTKPWPFGFTRNLQTDLQDYLTGACVFIVLLLAWFLDCLRGCHRMHRLYLCGISFRTHFPVDMGNHCTYFFCVGKCIMVVHLTFLHGIHETHVCHSLSTLCLFLFCIAYLRSLCPWWWPVFPSHCIIWVKFCQYV